MPRPSLKAVRTQEILQAYEACVARYGLEGATQERIAEEAGVKRTLLRHYLGNRDDMIDALIDHVIDKFDAGTTLLIEVLPEKNRIPPLLDILYGHFGASDTNQVAAIQALSAAADKYPKVRRAILQSMDRLVAAVENELRLAHPNAPDDARYHAVAFSVTHLYFSIDSCSGLNPPEPWWQHARTSAELLIASLEQSHDQ